MLTSKFDLEVPNLAPMVVKAVRLAGAVLGLVLIVAAAMIGGAVVYAYFHGDDRPLKAVLGLFGW